MVLLNVTRQHHAPIIFTPYSTISDQDITERADWSTLGFV